MPSQQYNTLLVNLCYSELEFNRCYEICEEKVKKGNSEIGFLDTTGVLENHNDFRKGALRLFSFDNNCESRRKASDKYVNYVSKLSDFKFDNGSHIRDFELNSLPLYWITDLSEKHPLYHILFNVFYFNELFNTVLQQVNFKKVIFLLPRDKFFYKESIVAFFSSIHKSITFNAISTGTFLRNVRETISFARQNFKEHTAFLSEYRKMKFNFIKEESKSFLLTFLGATWRSEKKADYVLDGIRSVTGLRTSYIPLIYNWNDIPKWNEKWDERYVKAMPGKKDWFFLMLNYFRTVKRISNVKDDDSLIAEGPVSPYVLKMEMLFTLQYKFYMFKNHLWLSNFFAKIKGCNIIYQDEFYSFGRVVSHAISKAGNSSSIGFQHGMIREDHTVYALTEIETKGKNKMPSPDYFVVWGQYFQDLVCKRAESMKRKVVIAANPNLIKKEDSEKNHLSENVIKAEYDLLWCSGIPQELSEEFALIKSYLKDHKNKKLLVRMHPLNDLSKEITDGLNEIGFKNYTFSNEVDLKKDFSKADLLISGPASTVVLEAVSIGMNVVGVNFGRYVPIEMGKSNYKEASNAEELNELIEDYFPEAKKEGNSAEVNSLFSRDFSKWKEILI